MVRNADSLSGKKLLPGLGTNLQFKIEGVVERLNGILVGMIPDTCLIIQGHFASVADKVPDGTRTTIRYREGDTVYGFNAEFKGIISHPEHLAFITYPEEIETIERRRQRRFKCFLPAEVMIGDEKRPGIIQDISERGCTFVIKVSPGGRALPIRVSDSLTLAFQWPGMDKKEAIVAEVRSIQFSVEFYKNEMRLGVKKCDDASEVLKRIADYLATFEPV